jgi:hypothetical protein
MKIEDVRGAVARGWCHEGNAHKEMDTTLAEAISQEVQELFEKQIVSSIQKLQLKEGDVLFVNPEAVDMECLVVSGTVKVPVVGVYVTPGSSVADQLAVASNPVTA